MNLSLKDLGSIVWEDLLLLFSPFMSDSLRPHGPQQASLPCPSLSSWPCSDSCQISRWCHPTISSSVISPSLSLQSFPASVSFLMDQFFASSGQHIGASVSALPVNSQAWFPLGLTCLISLQSKVLSRVFSITTIQRHQFFGAHSSLREIQVHYSGYVTRWFFNHTGNFFPFNVL